MQINTIQWFPSNFPKKKSHILCLILQVLQHQESSSIQNVKHGFEINRVSSFNFAKRKRKKYMHAHIHHYFFFSNEKVPGKQTAERENGEPLGPE